MAYDGADADPYYAPTVITTSTVVKKAPGLLGGIFVSSASNTPTITIYDSATAANNNNIVAQFTPSGPQWYPLPMQFFNGLYIVIGGTVSCTVTNL